MQATETACHHRKEIAVILDRMATAKATLSRPNRGRGERPPVTILNLSRCSLRLVHLEDAVTDDELPSLGSSAPWGQEVPFRVADTGPDRRVIAHFDVDDAGGHEVTERYVVSLGTDRICSAPRQVRTIAGPRVSPLTHVHLARDYIVLRDVAPPTAVPA